MGYQRRVHGHLIFYYQLYFVLLMKSHLQSYPCPLQINFFWNLGFLLGVAIILQIITGIFLALHYTSDLNSAYYQIFFLIREVYYGWCLRYFHSSGASFVFLFLFLHLGRAMFYGSYFYNPNTWFSGILLLFFLMAIAFMGYVLPFGQMSFWGATVITNLLSPFPSLIEEVCGGYCVHNPTLKRFFLFHFQLPFFSFILAWTFISLQIKEFSIMGLSINDSVYSSVFFFLTGLHCFHLLVGLFLLSLFFWGCSFPSKISFSLILRISEVHLFFNLQLFYWHFLEILWLFIFLVLYFYYHKISSTKMPIKKC